jgi:arabinofuranosyltransferase
MPPDAAVIHKTIYIALAVVGASLLSVIVRNRAVRLGLVVACFLFMGFILSLGLIDDAYISLRYARNFAEGHGLVFNIGERVEGYTCFLWVWLLGIMKRTFSGADLPQLAKTLSVGFGVLSLLTISRLAEYMGSGTWRSGTSLSRNIPFSLMLVAIYFPFVFWSFSGMETSFYLVWMVGSVYFFCRYLLEDNRRLTNLLLASLLLVFAAMTRPETYVIPLCNLGFIWYRDRKTWPKEALTFVTPFLAIFLPYFVWRYRYYGYLFPNTYYAKVGGGTPDLSLHGMSYLLNGVIPHLIFIAFILSKAIRRRKSLRLNDYYLMTLLVIWLGTTIYTGGDHFSELRFFVYMLPFMYLLIFDEIAALADYVGSRLTAPRASVRSRILRVGMMFVICLASFLVVFYYNSLGADSSQRLGRHLAERWALLGEWLEETTGSNDSVATPVVGAIGYYCNRTIIDMLGIVDSSIAHSAAAGLGRGPKDHERFNTEYVLSRNPKYIYVMPFQATEQAFLGTTSWIPAVEDLKRFFPHQGYQYGVVALGPHRFALYRRIDVNLGSEPRN